MSDNERIKNQKISISKSNDPYSGAYGVCERGIAYETYRAEADAVRGVKTRVSGFSGTRSGKGGTGYMIVGGIGAIYFGVMAFANAEGNRTWNIIFALICVGLIIKGYTDIVREGVALAKSGTAGELRMYPSYFVNEITYTDEGRKGTIATRYDNICAVVEDKGGIIIRTKDGAETVFIPRSNDDNAFFSALRKRVEEIN
ncbi:MAG: hypothetical protein IJC18_01380 [Clostridia bacterium]|nr:hypothetical protein [Clostridia bacterium]